MLCADDARHRMPVPMVDPRSMPTQAGRTSPHTSRLFSLPSRDPGVDRARYAVDLALHCLGGIEPATEIRDLVAQAELLRDEISSWTAHPPSSETREAVMCGALSIQVAALSLLGKGR